MAITDWPPQERPREKLLHQGAAALSDAELLAIFLRTGLPGRSAVDLARDLLQDFGDLRALLVADEDGFCARPGLGRAKYAQLQACLEMARRHSLITLRKGDALRGATDTRRFLQMNLRDLQHEVFAGLFLDNRHRVIRYETLFQGTIDGASVYPREVVKKALQYNAAAVIFAHNHPSGVAEPSEADKSLTNKLKDALGLVDIRVLDHMVVGDGEICSFAERGLI